MVDFAICNSTSDKKLPLTAFYRIKDETVERLDILSKETNRSRNELINILIDYAIDNCEVK